MSRAATAPCSAARRSATAGSASDGREATCSTSGRARSRLSGVRAPAQPGRLRRQLGGPPPVAGCVGHEPRGPLAPPPPVNAAPLASRENLRRLLHEVGPLLRFRCPAFEPRDVGAPLLR